MFCTRLLLSFATAICLAVVTSGGAVAAESGPGSMHPASGAFAMRALYYDRLVPSIGTPQMGVVFFVAQNHDPLNFYGKQPRMVECFFSESDPVLKQIAAWPAGLIVNVSGQFERVWEASGTPGVIGANEVRPYAGADYLTDCKFEPATRPKPTGTSLDGNPPYRAVRPWPSH